MKMLYLSLAICVLTRSAYAMKKEEINKSHYELPSIEIYGDEISEIVNYILAKSKKDLCRAQLFEEYTIENDKKEPKTTKNDYLSNRINY